MAIIHWIAGATLAFTCGPALAQDAEEGRLVFRDHCAVCHGLDATGNGPMKGVLVIKPANLQRLQQDNGGVFPTERVVKRIDGRDPLVSHGSPMPVYGPFFEGHDVAIKTPSGQPVLTSKPIVDVMAYLQSLQTD